MTGDNHKLLILTCLAVELFYYVKFQSMKITLEIQKEIQFL
jgi:hypothetical protein